MPEMALAGEDHRCAGFVGGFDGFQISQRAAGLDDRGDAGVQEQLRAVGERKKRIAGGDGVFGAGAGFLDGDSGGIDAINLPAPDAYRHLIFCDDDRVGFDVFAREPCDF